ncbi:MAG TPA: PEGA domain-containing protein [Anaeromyxobacteraceae bacterium]|nr:PEGA domain-containing protein [Anaeromyxobacteraceae bacterium]
MTPRHGSASLLGLAVLACAPKAPSWSEVRPPEAYVETLPPGALVQVNGEEVGRAPLTFPVRDPDATYRVRAHSSGFEVAEVEVPGAKAANGRLDIVLRPTGFGSQRRLDLGDAAGLAQAGALLAKAGHATEALAFAKASLAVAETALAHRVAGEAYRQLGDRSRAVQEFSVYITLQPDAPDRAAVEKAIEAARGDITIPGLRP